MNWVSVDREVIKEEAAVKAWKAKARQGSTGPMSNTYWIDDAESVAKLLNIQEQRYSN